MPCRPKGSERCLLHKGPKDMFKLQICTRKGSPRCMCTRGYTLDDLRSQGNMSSCKCTHFGPEHISSSEIVCCFFLLSYFLPIASYFQNNTVGGWLTMMFCFLFRARSKRAVHNKVILEAEKKRQTNHNTPTLAGHPSNRRLKRWRGTRESKQH